MGSHLTENLKLQVRCLLCEETMVEPKLLPCFHTFCKQCIKRNVQLGDKVNIFMCPQCTSETRVQELDDVEDIPKSPIHARIVKVLSFIENQNSCSISSSHCQALWQCLDCDRSFCDECLENHSLFTNDHKVVSLSELKDEDIEMMLRKENSCSWHTKQDVEFHCKDCNELICRHCLAERHYKHMTLSLQEFILTKKDFLSKNLNEVAELTSNEEEKKLQEQIALNIKREGEKVKEKVKTFTKSLIKKLMDHEQQLLDEIHTSMTKAASNLRIIRHSSAAQDYIKYFIENGTASEMIDIQDKHSCQMFTYNPFEKCNDEMVFQANKQLTQQVNAGLGLIRSFEKPDPKMSSLKVESNIEVGKHAKLTVSLKSSQTKHYDTSPDDVIVEEKQVTTDGQIKVTFTPRVPGQLIADVKPQQIKERTTRSKLIKALNTGSKEFRGISVNKTNTKIAVVDESSHCVRVFNLEGDLLLTYGSEGSKHGQLSSPEGLSFLNETDVVIVDYCNRRICIVNTDTGKLLRNFGCEGNGNGQFSTIFGVHVDNDSNIIVCDNENDRIQVFTNDGEYRHQFNLLDNGAPFDVVTHNGLYYVSDVYNPMVQVIDNQSLTTVTTIGMTDYTYGVLKAPRGLAIDNDFNLLVADRQSKSIHKFTLDGKYIGKTVALDHAPLYIAVLNNGEIICTSQEGGVHIF